MRTRPLNALLAGAVCLAAFPLSASAFTLWVGTSPDYLYPDSSSPSFGTQTRHCILPRFNSFCFPNARLNSVTLGVDANPSAGFFIRDSNMPPAAFTATSLTGSTTATFNLTPTQSYTLTANFAASGPGGGQADVVSASGSSSITANTQLGSFLSGSNDFDVTVSFSPHLSYSVTKSPDEYWFHLDPPVIASVTYDFTILPDQIITVAPELPGNEGHTFAVVSTDIPFSEALASANAVGGHLAHIATPGEGLYIASLFSGASFWTGDTSSTTGDPLVLSPSGELVPDGNPASQHYAIIEYSAIPEPASLGILALGALALLNRRKI